MSIVILMGVRDRDQLVCSLDLEEGGENQKAVVALTLNHNGRGAVLRLLEQSC